MNNAGLCHHQTYRVPQHHWYASFPQIIKKIIQWANTAWLRSYFTRLVALSHSTLIAGLMWCLQMDKAPKMNASLGCCCAWLSTRGGTKRPSSEATLEPFPAKSGTSKMPWFPSIPQAHKHCPKHSQSCRGGRFVQGRERHGGELMWFPLSRAEQRCTIPSFGSLIKHISQAINPLARMHRFMTACFSLSS